eukprot:scaffold228767_cov31-Tisochrysis_lutea.AAC.2
MHPPEDADPTRWRPRPTAQAIRDQFRDVATRMLRTAHNVPSGGRHHTAMHAAHLMHQIKLAPKELFSMAIQRASQLNSPPVPSWCGGLAHLK